jgi:hypothetical protein
MVEPNDKMQQNYKTLLALEEELISSLRDGNIIVLIYIFDAKKKQNLD